MRITLLNAIFEKKRISEPMGICFIAAVLRQQGYEVDIMEPRLDGDDVETSAERILEKNAAILGISSFSFQRGRLLRLVHRIREKGFGGLVVLGGLGPTLNREFYVRQCREIDAVVLGEGERTLLEIVECVRRAVGNGGSTDAWKQVPGVAYLSPQHEVVVVPGRRRMTNLDELPFMARDILERNIAKYGRDMIFAPIMAGRGCYRRCSYCWIASALDMQEGERFRQRSVTNVLDEVEAIIKRYAVTRFSFEDDTFVTPGPAGLERSRDFRQQVRERGLNFEFFFQTRPDTISREAIKNYRSAGLGKIFIGIETITEDDIGLYGKGTTLEQIVDVLRLLSELGYSPDVGREDRGRVRFGYIAFNPLTTLAGFRRSLAFFRRFRLTPKRLLTYVNLCDGDLDIKRAYAERGFEVASAGERVFKHPEVEVLFHTLETYAARVFAYREPIRSIEKHVARRGIPKDDVWELASHRGRLDEMVLEFAGVASEILAESGGDLVGARRRIAEALGTRFEQLDSYVRDTRLLEAIRAANLKYGAEEDMYDVYW